MERVQNQVHAMIGAGMPGVKGFLRFVIEAALPVWMSSGIDPRDGCFIERIRLDGTPDGLAPRRLRVQARQVYVYAEASRLGWIDARVHLSRAFGCMIERYRGRDGGFIFSCDADGSPLDRTCYAYEQAFVLLACAGGFRLTEDSAYLEVAGQVQAFLDERLADAGHGGYFNAEEQTEPRSQNPHMHLFEAYLALFEATGKSEWRRRAEAMLGLFVTHFLDSRCSLREFFTRDWRPASGEAGLVREPGHHFEWTWLLARYRALCPNGLAVPAGAPAGFGFAGGVDPRDGLAFDEIGPGLHPRRMTKRLWPQTELLKALLAAAEAKPTAARTARIDAVSCGLVRRYLLAGRGLWHDQLDPTGAVVPGPAPASTLYHLFVVASEIERVGTILTDV